MRGSAYKGVNGKPATGAVAVLKAPQNRVIQRAVARRKQLTTQGADTIRRAKWRSTSLVPGIETRSAIPLPSMEVFQGSNPSDKATSRQITAAKCSSVMTA